ncbi:acyltransferase family protein [Microlunatus aurantiacus]
MSTAVRPLVERARWGPDAVSSAEAATETPFRPEVQGLRALAVGLVVFYHLWPNRLTGGFVGVDVFFVISGFLITSHIFRESAVSGRLQVTRFWARRIRRLLPASLLVLALSSVAVILWLPSTQWATTFRQVVASALYVENWALAAAAVDYMAADNVPTVAQHYWSLSVEEQFYLVWPLLIVGLLQFQRWAYRRSTALAGRRSPATSPEERRRILLVGLGLLGLVSLTWSVYATSQDQPIAYLSTFTRAWEFSAGAVAALVTVRLGARARIALGWLGVVAMLWAGWSYTDSSAFPGWIALVPVLGTVAVILAGHGGPRTAGWWLARRPATFVGDISYSVYLIHWPLIVLVPAVTGSSLTLLQKVAILAATVVLAWVSKTYVEDPLRQRPMLAASPRRAYVFAVVGMAFVVGGVGVTSAVHQKRLDLADAAAVSVLESGDPCLGPRALADPAACGGVEGARTLVAPESLKAQASAARLFDCQTNLTMVTVLDCVVGQPGGKATVALVGDSHAGMWRDAMDAQGRAEGFSVRIYAKSGCPLTQARRVLASETSDARQLSCERWRQDVMQRLRQDTDIRDVVTSAFSSSYTWQSVPDGQELADPASDGFTEVWRPLLEQGKRVHVVRDTPTPQRSVPSCLEAEADATACNWPRSEALTPDIQAATARALVDDGVEGVDVVDLTESFCDRRTCYAQVGGIPVFRDRSHMSQEYSRLMGQFLATEIDLPR